MLRPAQLAFCISAYTIHRTSFNDTIALQGHCCNSFRPQNLSDAAHASVPNTLTVLLLLCTQVKVSSLAAKAAVAGAARQQIGAFGYVAQLDGLIPPWVADRLCVVLAEAQGAGGLRVRRFKTRSLNNL